jgi:hypothetical protein
MAVYTNDLRLKEIATGDESGTWGTSTNTNLSLVAEAFSFGTEAITTNADTHTTTIADGSTDPGRSLFLKYTGTLDSACTITIGPNTVSKLWLIQNSTSGSQNIIIKQGSGATVTVPNGQTKAIYSDGAGSGAAMVDAFQDLSIPDLFIDDDLTFTSDSAVITFGADGDTTLTHTDGSGLTLNSTNKIMFNDASQFIQGSSATVLSLGATDEIDLTATAIDVNGTIDVSGNATLGGTVGVTGVLTANAGVVVDNITIDGTEIDLSSGDLTIDVAGNILLNADGGGIYFQDASLLVGSLQNSSSDFLISAEVADKDIIFRGVDGSSTIDALKLDMSAGGTAFFADDVRLTDNHAVRLGTDGDIVFYHDNSNGYLENGTGDFTLDVAGDIILDADGEDIRFKDGGTQTFVFTMGTGSTISTPRGSLTLDVAGALVLDADTQGSGNGVLLKDGGTHYGSFFRSSSNFHIKSESSDNDMIFMGNDGGSEITALTLDMSAAGAATFNSSITSGGNITVGGTNNLIVNDSGAAVFGNDGDISIGNSGANGLISAPNGNLTLDVSGELILDSDAEIVRIYHDGGNIGSFQMTSNDFIIRSMVSDKDLVFKGNDGGSTITALTLDMSDSGTAIFGSWQKMADNNRIVFGAGSDMSLFSDGTDGNILVDGNLDFDVSGNIKLDADDAGEVRFLDGGTQYLYLKKDGNTAVIQNVIADGDIQFRGTDGSSLITPVAIDMSEGGKVGVGITTPDSLLHVRTGDAGGVTAHASSVLTLEAGGVAILQFLTPNNVSQQIRFGDPQDNGAGFIDYDHSSSQLAFGVNGPTRGFFNSSGHLVLGSASHNDDVLYVVRGNNGKLIRLFHGSTEAGALSTKSTGNQVALGSPNSGGGIVIGSDATLPSNANGDGSNNTQDLGSSSYRWATIFAQNALNTSDEKLKQDIEELSETERRVAIACKGLVRKYKFKEDVVSKGADAKIRIGIIAQQLVAAFEAEGLDAHDYALISLEDDTEQTETGMEKTGTQTYNVNYLDLLAFIISAI